MRRLLLAVLAVAAVTVGWLWRGLIRSVALRSVLPALPNPAKRRGIDISFPVHGTGWTRLIGKNDLSPLLSGVVGYPLEAAAWSHYGGFNLSRVYSDYVNPDSNYYQAWIGAYIVFDNERRKPLVLMTRGSQSSRTCWTSLRRTAGGCSKTAAARICSRRPRGETCQRHDGHRGGHRRGAVVEDGRPGGDWSSYHRGNAPGHWPHYAAYGRVPDNAPHPVDDFHPLIYSASIWLRYLPQWQATCVKHYIWCEYTDRNGQRVTRGQQLEAECQAIVDRIAFVKR